MIYFDIAAASPRSVGHFSPPQANARETRDPVMEKGRMPNIPRVKAQALTAAVHVDKFRDHTTGP